MGDFNPFLFLVLAAGLLLQWAHLDRTTLGGNLLSGKGYQSLTPTLRNCYGGRVGSYGMGGGAVEGSNGLRPARCAPDQLPRT